MPKFKEIIEDNRCPICNDRLFYKSMPARSEFEHMMDANSFPKNWYCSKCDKYFKEVEDNNNEHI